MSEKPPFWKSLLVAVGGTTKFCEVEECHNMVGIEHDYCPQEHRLSRGE